MFWHLHCSCFLLKHLQVVEALGSGRTPFRIETSSQYALNAEAWMIVLEGGDVGCGEGVGNGLS